MELSPLMYVSLKTVTWQPGWLISTLLYLSDSKSLYLDLPYMISPVPFAVQLEVLKN